jgi:molybdopterin synthase catalytic subunit
MQTAKKPKQLFIQGPIPPDFIADSIAKHSTKTNIGAHAIFLGQVRADAKDGKQVTGIHYSAYAPMAEQIMAQMRESFFAKYDDMTCLHIYHSLGEVKAGEISLFVFVSCRHRKQSFEALEHIVDQLKADLPVWKQEFYDDASYRWV